MASNPRVLALLEEMLESSRTAEEVCRECPELLAEVQRRWKAFRYVDDSCSSLFPDPETPLGTDANSDASDSAETPEVPGYRIEELLGRGGMGVVYRAWHLRLDRAVALKMLLAGRGGRAGSLERFPREARAVASLRHPNIVQVYDVGDVDGRPYFTMELIEGGDLAKRIAGAPQSPRQAAVLVATLADAIEVAHRNGIVHRDLKPGNVMLTADGTPKVTDFGLARRLDGDTGQTLSGTPVGTPSYMAPEQARGDQDAIGPAADIYALGAILYELLTGRPPFRSDTASATLHQVVEEEPVPPRRLNRRVPRDLETVCLKCLNKEPSRRYATAQALADDLRRFERGEPILARPLRWPGRWLRWARRRPAAAAVAVTLPSAALLAVALVGNWWLDARDRSAHAIAIEEDLREAALLANLSAWDPATAVLNRAEGRLARGSTPALRLRADRLAAELKLGMRLEELRLNRSPLVGGQLSRANPDHDYQAAFLDGQLANGLDDPDQAAARIRGSCVRRSIVAALDDWAVFAPDVARQTWCLQVAQKADVDADEWRQSVRDPQAWRDRSTLAKLAAAAPVSEESLSLLVSLGLRLEELGGDATSLFQRILAEHPDDFSTNLRLGNAVLSRDPIEAISYFRAALAVRPGAVVAANNLAVALRAAGRQDEAIACYERALRLYPDCAPAHNNLGLALRDKGKLDEAQASFERAIAIDPTFVHAHMNLGNLLRRKQEAAGAIACYQEAARLNPRLSAAHYSLGLITAEQGRTPEAIQHYQKAVEVDTTDFRAHANLGRLLVSEGRLDEGIRHLQTAIDLEPGDNLAHKNLGRALQEKGLPNEALLHLFQSHYLKKEYVAAARLYADAFAAEPKLAQDVKSEHAYRAARAAALAGCGAGTDGATLNDLERARWRQQAVAWLREQLAARARGWDSAASADRRQLQESLAQWCQDSDLAGIRDQDALELLQSIEREECRALWQEVAALLQRAQTTK